MLAGPALPSCASTHDCIKSCQGDALDGCHSDCMRLRCMPHGARHVASRLAPALPLLLRCCMLLLLCTRWRRRGLLLLLLLACLHQAACPAPARSLPRSLGLYAG